MTNQKTKEERLLKNVELASKIVLKEDEKLFKELGKEQKMEEEIERLDKQIHKSRKSFCPKCKKKMNSFKEIEDHIKKTKHYGDYASLIPIELRSNFASLEWERKKAYLKGFQQGKAEAQNVLCSKCGFPKEWERNPVFLKNDIFSLMHAEDNTCEECGHQADGYTIKKFEPLLQKYLEFGKKQAIKEFEKERAELIKQKQDIIRKEGYPASDIVAVLRKEIREEVMEIIDEMLKDSSDGENEDIMDYNEALIELKSKLHSQQKTSAKSETQFSRGELAEASMQRKPKQQHNPADTNSQNEKLVKCIACGKPIHIDELAGITNEGMYHNNLVCFMRLER